MLEKSKEEAWGYFGEDNIYAKVGDFNILNNALELETHGSDLPQKQLDKLARFALYVYTFNKKIYRIKVTIKESDKNFNDVLKETYGPAVNDNGYNIVDYLNDSVLKWESKNVLLTSILDIELTYIKDTDGTTKLSSLFDKYRYIEYLYKPLQIQLEDYKNNKEKQKLHAASERL